MRIMHVSSGTMNLFDNSACTITKRIYLREHYSPCYRPMTIGMAAKRNLGARIKFNILILF